MYTTWSAEKIQSTNSRRVRHQGHRTDGVVCITMLVELSRLSSGRSADHIRYGPGAIRPSSLGRHLATARCHAPAERRWLCLRERTQRCDRASGIASLGRNGVDQLLKIVADSEDDRIPEGARLCLQMLAAQLAVNQQILENDCRVIASARRTDVGRRLMGYSWHRSTCQCLCRHRCRPGLQCVRLCRTLKDSFGRNSSGREGLTRSGLPHRREQGLLRVRP